MQETKQFTAADGKTILVEVNSLPENKSAVLIVHGFTGHINEHFHYNTAQLFPRKGLDVWRIALYPGRPGTRSMTDVTWEQNFSDINQVLEEMGKLYSQLFLIGHSRGGTLAVYAAHPKLFAKVLWDASCYPEKPAQEDLGLHPDYYTLDWGTILLVGKKYTDGKAYWSKYDTAPREQPPTLLVRASASEMGWPKFFKVKKAVIKDSNHTFDKEGNEKKLFSLTLNFFKKHDRTSL
jgi:pimeloyl-ACP methyl ester carboxylesterase